MAALGLPFINSLNLPKGAAKRLNSTRSNNYNHGICIPFSPKLKPSYKTHCHSFTVRMQTDLQDDYSVKQIKEMAAARKRWEALIREGKVKVLTPKEAGYAIQLSNKTLLDVRPSTEHKKAWVKGSFWIPIFDVDSRFDAGALSKKIMNFVMGGWWSGIPVFRYDNQFISKVEEKLPKHVDLIVACQKGLRAHLHRRIGDVGEKLQHRTEKSNGMSCLLSKVALSQCLLLLVSNCIMQGMKISFGFKGVSRQLKRRILKGTVLNLSNLLELVEFLSSLVGVINNEQLLSRKAGAID